ncbi:MAG: type 1 glutamine amidotransferase [Aquabacterium sp.]|uniref:type 1 glutamine amidotransferase n=1 Tax=Aquabacterium sp. TaxID=1872578 RepID=UPI003BC93E6A
MRPVALIQHERTQGPGRLLDYLTEQHIPTVTFMPDEGDDVPIHAKDYSGVVFLGSQHSVNEPLRWINREVLLCLSALEADVPLLGHCFGAQLMAKTLGAPVRRNAWPNIGWSTLRTTPFAKELFGADLVPAFNWHYDTFGIPARADRLLFGPYCINKAFRLGKHLAFQCHFEVTQDIIQTWCAQSASELASAKGPAVQSAQCILSAMPQALPEVHRFARRVYQHWAAGLPRVPMVSYACTR